MYETDMSKVREVIARLFRGDPIPEETVQAARAILQKICNEASEYGLTPAEVTKVAFRPLFEPQRGCDCWKCKSRRGDLNEEEILDATLPVI